MGTNPAINNTFKYPSMALSIALESEDEEAQ